MADREKLIKWLEYCTSLETCEGCPYVLDKNCCQEIKQDVFELLKEQEMQIIELKEKLRLMYYGDQESAQSLLMPAT